MAEDRDWIIRTQENMTICLEDCIQTTGGFGSSLIEYIEGCNHCNLESRNMEVGKPGSGYDISLILLNSRWCTRGHIAYPDFYFLCSYFLMLSTELVTFITWVSLFLTFFRLFFQNLHANLETEQHISISAIQLIE